MGNWIEEDEEEKGSGGGGFELGLLIRETGLSII